jgi:hypothetical protein
VKHQRKNKSWKDEKRSIVIYNGKEERLRQNKNQKTRTQEQK